MCSIKSLLNKSEAVEMDNGPSINDVSSKGEGGGPPSKPIYYISLLVIWADKGREGGNKFRKMGRRRLWMPFSLAWLGQSLYEVEFDFLFTIVLTKNMAESCRKVRNKYINKTRRPKIYCTNYLCSNFLFIEQQFLISCILYS